MPDTGTLGITSSSVSDSVGFHFLRYIAARDTSTNSIVGIYSADSTSPSTCVLVNSVTGIISTNDSLLMSYYNTSNVSFEMPPTPELQQELERQRQERRAVTQNAENLLLSVLDEQQRRDWAERGCFYVRVGPRRYRIRRGRVGNIDLVDEQGETLERYCAHPQQAVPDADTAVAQMLHLKYDEQRFIGLANVHYTKPGFVRGF